MTTSDQNQPQQGAGEQGGAAAAAPAHEAGASSEQRQQGRHERGRRRGGGRRPEQEQQQQPRQQQRPQQPPRRGDATLNLEELRDLAELFSAHGLTDFEFENADVRIRLSRNAAPQPGAPAQAATPSIPIPPPQQAPASALSAAAHSSAPPAAEQPAQRPGPQASSAPAAAPEEELHIITSPIVGTFYRSPAPTAEAFVKVGSHVGPDTVVCIIEAMKLMNEIQAETEGTVEKIYVENGQPVEYGQPLFGVKR